MMAMMCLVNGELTKYSLVKSARGRAKDLEVRYDRVSMRESPALVAGLPLGDLIAGLAKSC